MSRIRARDTKPEMTVRRAMHASGLRYRVHVKGMPGRPDLVFPSRRTVLFIHGCYWHAHSDPACTETHKPKSRTEYWNPKLAGNVARDARHVATLQSDGWMVITAWECEVARPDFVQDLVNRVRALPVVRPGRPRAS